MRKGNRNGWKEGEEMLEDGKIEENENKNKKITYEMLIYATEMISTPPIGNPNQPLLYVMVNA